MLLLGIALFVLAVVIGLPVAFALLLASAPTFLTGAYLPPQIAVQKMVAVTQSYPLMAIPFFVLAGNIMVASGIAARLVTFSRVVVGWMVGGLAQVSIVLSLVMGGISGSAVADAAMQSRLLGGPMIAKGYAPGFAAGVITYSSIITALIPPSIGLIVFGVIANVSVGRLLLAGIIPGLILTVALMAYTWFAARRAGYGSDDMPPRPFAMSDARLCARSGRLCSRCSCCWGSASASSRRPKPGPLLCCTRPPSVSWFMAN